LLRAWPYYRFPPRKIVYFYIHLGRNAKNGESLIEIEWLKGRSAFLNRRNAGTEIQHAGTIILFLLCPHVYKNILMVGTWGVLWDRRLCEK
jgi:hypothetical protein